MDEHYKYSGLTRKISGCAMEVHNYEVFQNQWNQVNLFQSRFRQFQTC